MNGTGIDIGAHGAMSVDFLLKSLGVLAAFLAIVLALPRKYRNDHPPRP